MIQTGRVGWTAFSLVALLATGCGQPEASASASSAVSGTPKPAPPITVVVRNLAFAPAAVTIPAGGQVTWDFQDGAVPHTVTSDTNDFGSAPDGLTTGTFQHVFARPGSYAYHCDFHQKMKGTVTVR